MGIGVGIFLIALGAILTFAVKVKVSGLDLHAVGWVLMIAGVGGLVLFFYFWNRRRTVRPVAVDRPTYVESATPPPPQN
jgi:Na+/proline symporter